MTKQGEVRDWQKDIELCTEVTPMVHKDEFIRMSIYWLQQYAAEKELSDRLMSELDASDKEIYKLQKEYASLDETAANDYDKLTATEAREKKLREAIEKAISQSWSGDMSALLDIKNELKASLYPKEEEAK